MDRMEASVSNNGEFFVRTGSKPGGMMHYDSRALILKEGRKSNYRIRDEFESDTGEDFDYVVITRKGPVIVTMKKHTLENDLVAGYDERRSYGGGFHDVYGGLSLTTKSFTFNAPTREITSKEDKEFVSEAMRRSIEVAKERLKTKPSETDLQKQAMTRNLSELLNV